MSVCRTMRWRALGVVLLLAALFGLGLGLASCGSRGTLGAGSRSPSSSAPRTEGGTTPNDTAAGTASGTQQVVFDPYSSGGTLRPTIIVTRTASGTCVTPGVAGTSSYRCFAQPGSSVYDPCFAPPRAVTGPLVCVADPAQPAATRFMVGILPAEPATGPTERPWAMRLSNGQSCVFVAAAWDGLGPFACSTAAVSGRSEADCHQPARATPRWVADCQATQSPSSPFHRVQVVTIWT